MQVIDDPVAARRWVHERQREGKRIGLVPTMGALHDGHLSLVQASRAECDATVVTIYVNPTQFGPNEDFQKYPRTLERDLEQLRAREVALVFTPSDAVMYPPGFSTYVEPPAVARRWEGEHRPGHFRGVATVVMKLFNIIPADVAFFGQKDYQQTRVVLRMVEDLNIPVQIKVCPTVREDDGLAMSSRNQYLSAEERRRATALYRGLQAGRAALEQGTGSPHAVCQAVRQVLIDAGINDIDYIALADPESLEPLEVARPPAVLLVAARVGGTRLIDNVVIPKY
ncbi:MAG: pantothenate synthetase [Pirellulaceae bacterium]|nr:MAG: pantothenate synthetase [Pirellulaceae bacterium]